MYTSQVMHVVIKLKILYVQVFFWLEKKKFRLKYFFFLSKKKNLQFFPKLCDKWILKKRLKIYFWIFEI